MMERGEEFFDVVNATDIDTVLTRSKRIGNIAFTAAKLAGETLQLEGDHISKQLVRAAYLGIGDITARVVSDADPDQAETLLTSDQTHRTLLFLSKTMRSPAFDTATREFRSHGARLHVSHDGLRIDDSYHVPRSEQGMGCPYAMGDPRKAAYFTTATDNIVRTYTEAYRRGMPRNLAAQILRR